MNPQCGVVQRAPLSFWIIAHAHAKVSGILEVVSTIGVVSSPVCLRNWQTDNIWRADRMESELVGRDRGKFPFGSAIATGPAVLAQIFFSNPAIPSLPVVV